MPSRRRFGGSLGRFRGRCEAKVPSSRDPVPSTKCQVPDIEHPDFRPEFMRGRVHDLRLPWNLEPGIWNFECGSRR